MCLNLHQSTEKPLEQPHNNGLSQELFFVFLLQDKRNFLRNPPAGVQFQFDFESMFPVAMATLQEDENLNKMRFELVPKQYVFFFSLYT